MNENEFKIELAGAVFKIIPLYGFVKEFCKDFLTQKEPVYEIGITLNDIEEEQVKTAYKILPQYLETTCVYRRIAELLPLCNRVVVHGVALKYKDKGYLFIAPSGTGKTTHANLWKKYLGQKAEIINGDKPILEFVDDKIILHSTPWCGKEGAYKKTTAELRTVCIIRRGEKNVIIKTDCVSRLSDLLVQVYMPNNKLSAEKTIDLISLLCETDAYLLNCNVSKEAFNLSFKNLTGETYDN